MADELSGSVALVTGVDCAAGQAVLAGLAGAGARIIVGGRLPDELTARQISDDFDFVDTDMSDENSVLTLARSARELGSGRVDIVVCHVGNERPGPDADEAGVLFAVNIQAPHLLLTTLAPEMIEHGRGTAVTVWVGDPPSGELTEFVKVGLRTVTAGWNAELREQGIRVELLGADEPAPTPRDLRAAVLDLATRRD